MLLWDSHDSQVLPRQDGNHASLHHRGLELVQSHDGPHMRREGACIVRDHSGRRRHSWTVWNALKRFAFSGGGQAEGHAAGLRETQQADGRGPRRKRLVYIMDVERLWVSHVSATGFPQHSALSCFNYIMIFKDIVKWLLQASTGTSLASISSPKRKDCPLRSYFWILSMQRGTICWDSCAWGVCIDLQCCMLLLLNLCRGGMPYGL